MKIKLEKGKIMCKKEHNVNEFEARSEFGQSDDKC